MNQCTNSPMTHTDGGLHRQRRLRIAVFMQTFSGGGIERLYGRLSNHWQQSGHDVTFIVNKDCGPSREELAEAIRVVQLKAKKPARSVVELVRYARENRPDIMLSGHDHANLALCAASLFAGRSATRFVAGQHNSLSGNKLRGWKDRVVPTLYRMLLKRSDIFAVSNGVSLELQHLLRLPPERVPVIYNGVIPDDLNARLTDPEVDTFFRNLPFRPTVLGMGRFVAQKDFPTLIRAFAILRKQFAVDANLLILGEGPMRAEMEALAAELGVRSDVKMPGFKTNAFAYLARSSLFVLSSRYEGFGNVVAEALACGTPVVATDCPSGPAEIVDNGRYGTLVPIEDPHSMAQALRAALASDANPQMLKERGNQFSEGVCAQAYIDMFLTARPQTSVT